MNILYVDRPTAEVSLGRSPNLRLVPVSRWPDGSDRDGVSANCLLVLFSVAPRSTEQKSKILLDSARSTIDIGPTSTDTSDIVFEFTRDLLQTSPVTSREVIQACLRWFMPCCTSLCWEISLP